VECASGASLSYQDLDFDELERRINNEWAALRNAAIERATGEWRQHLRACIRAKGGHFK